MRIFLSILLLSLVTSHPRALTIAPTPAGRMEFFESRIRPLLAAECYSCHSASAAKIKGGLALDTRAAVLKGGDSNQPSLIPGDPDASLLIKAVKYADPDLQMPPKKRLSGEQIADLIAWVKTGAPDPREGPIATLTKAAAAPKHWAFQPIADPAIPSIAGSTPIDRFINEKLAESHLAPAARASKLALIRRATYDLTGLPPTPLEIEAFVTDPSESAFVKVVDRLLASKAYGERWGRKWLDLARYADTAGESADFPIPQAYHYRNYVIDAFNADLPYDEFLKEQIAGDLLPSTDEKDRERKTVATGFLATAKRFGVDPENQMHLTIDDVIDTLGKSTLALSLSCCRCHDHKFDPISSKEYYSLYGIFASTRFPFPGAENHKYQMDFVPLTPKEKGDALLAAYRAKLEPARAEANRLQKEWEHSRGSPDEGERYGQWQAAMTRVKELTAAGPGCEMAYAVAEGQSHDVHVMKRGEPYNSGELAPRGFLTVLGGQKIPSTEKGSGRLELANWIASADNPLTARVMVNRLWQGHFGHGLVRTPSDFGTRGSPPTHPQLLDYLAQRFIESGWSVKTIQRAIMLTDAYQRSSAVDSAAQDKDANNDLLSHFDRRRLEAEEIRDSILAIAGNLDPMPGGPHPFPTADKWNFTQHDAFKDRYETTKRSIYVMQQRIRRLPFFATFDGPDPNATTAERTSSTTPLQALYMMNDAFVHDESVVFAKALMRAAHGEEAQLRRAAQLVYGRPAADDEVHGAVDYEHAYAAKLSATSQEKSVETLAAYARVLFCSNEFFYVD